MRSYLDRLTLAYIILCFSTTATFLLLSRPGAQHFAQYHWLGYWLINSILLFNAWLFINAGTREAWERKVIATIVLPAALLVANLLFPYLLEGGKPVATIIIPLFLMLGAVAAATGYIGTRGNPRDESTSENLTQAKLALKGSLPTLAFVVAGAFGALAAEYMRNVYVRIFNDIYLSLAAYFIIGGMIATFLALPYIILHTTKVPAQPPH